MEAERGTGPDGLPVLAFGSGKSWDGWLSAHAGVGGAWLMLGKKGCREPSVSYREAVDVALCHGWIDGQIRGCDEQYYLQRFTPRRPRSNWTPGTCARAQQLADAGRMHPAGLAAMEQAKAAGRWHLATPDAGG